VKPLILQDDSFAKELENHQIILSGDGSLKCTELFANNKNVEIHPEILCSALGMISKSDELFSQNRFEDIAYFEPFYLKEFIAGMPNVKGLR
jgi:tRNA threonylcarbamoyladenosine biosynthesis protein TsaB